MEKKPTQAEVYAAIDKMTQVCDAGKKEVKAVFDVALGFAPALPELRTGQVWLWYGVPHLLVQLPKNPAGNDSGEETERMLQFVTLTGRIAAMPKDIPPHLGKGYVFAAPSLALYVAAGNKI